MENLRQQFYKKETNTDIYINWNSHARMQWKIDTLKNLVKRSIIICSDQDLLQKEVGYLRKVFVKINDYLTITLENIIENELQKENVNTTNNHKEIQKKPKHGEPALYRNYVFKGFFV